jgi:hypothetical protein
LNRLQRAALVALVIHLIAGLSMALILSRGLETTPNLHMRLTFLVNYRLWWTAAWLSWTGASIAILYFYVVFREVHGAPPLAVFLTIAAVGLDLSGQAIEIGLLPTIAARVLSENASPAMFLMLHRMAEMLSGYAANGLYSISALLLVFATCHAYPTLVSAFGSVVGFVGILLSIAVLLDSTAGMFWTNVMLVPSILCWLGLVAIARKGAMTTKPFPLSLL